jgi:hypothetical protein
LHVHTDGNELPNGGIELIGPQETARIMLFCGVGAYLDLAAHQPSTIFKARNDQRSHPGRHADEADIYCVGAAFGTWNLPDAKTAGKQIDSYIQTTQPDAIKFIYGKNTLSKGALVQGIKASREAGLKTIVHIGTWEHASDAIEAGASVVTHLFDDEIISDSLVRKWASSRTQSMPTMAVQIDMSNIARNRTFLDDKLLMQTCSPRTLQIYRQARLYDKKGRYTVQWQNEDRNNDFRSFQKLSRAGVSMLAGSDSSNIGTFPGFSLHRELKLMSEAGFSNWDALRAGTTLASKFLNRPSGIEYGDRAELVVLDGNPIANIANTEKVSAIVHRGILVDRDSLRSHLHSL